MRTLFASAAAAAITFAATPAAAVALFTVNIGAGASVYNIPTVNNFKSQLNGLGLYDYVTVGSSVTINGPAVITFEYMGSESGFVDHFSAAGGLVTGTETGTHSSPVNHFGDPTPPVLGSAVFTGTSVDFVFTSSKDGALTPAPIGNEGFGIFIPGVKYSGTLVGPATYETSVLYFGYDDQIVGDDDNHDDFIIRATISAAPVPEPATWAMMIGGFGLAGAAMRLRARRGAAIA